jgi:hypothetical protein
MLYWVKPACLDLIKKHMLIPCFFPLQERMTSSFFKKKTSWAIFQLTPMTEISRSIFLNLRTQFLSFFLLETLSNTQYKPQISSYLSQNIKIITFKNKNQLKKKPNWFWFTIPKIFIGKASSPSNFSWEEEHINTKITFFCGQNIANQKLSFICYF